MSPREEPPDVDRLARSMLMLHGSHDGHDGHDGHDEEASPSVGGRLSGSWSKAPAFASDPERAAAVREASRADRERYLTTGLQPVDCRFCHITVSVKRLGPGHTVVQWNTEALQRCAHFSEIRASGGDTARSRACPRLTDSIEHAVVEGCLEVPSPDTE